MFWRWNFEIEICNLQLKLSFVFPLLWDVDLKIEIALCMNDFLCSSIFTDIPFSLLCLFFSLCYSLCLLPFSGVSFVLLNVDWAMGVIGITNGDESFRPAWRWDLRFVRQCFNDVPEIFSWPFGDGQAEVMSDLALDLNGSSCLSRS